jgi:hypothetical protein
LHSSIVPIIPDKGLVFVGEVDKRARNSRVVLDPDVHKKPVVPRKAWTSVRDLHRGQLQILAIFESSRIQPS